jgi:hypothetical protein
VLNARAAVNSVGTEFPGFEFWRRLHNFSIVVLGDFLTGYDLPAGYTFPAIDRTGAETLI